MSSTAETAQLNSVRDNQFDSAISALLTTLKRDYQRGVNRDLSRHEWQGLFARHVLAGVEALLAQCSEILIDTQFNQAIAGGPKIDKPSRLQFVACVANAKNDLIEFALHLHRSSCAMSNFPEEHNPSSEYLADVLAQTEQRWSEWCAMLRL